MTRQSRLRINQHTRQRYREHHPNASDDEIRVAFSEGESISAELVNALLQRRGVANPNDAFQVAPDKRGIFVLQGDAFITYLRLEPSQAAILERPPETANALASQRRGEQLKAEAHDHACSVVGIHQSPGISVTQTARFNVTSGLDKPLWETLHDAIMRLGPGQTRFNIGGFNFILTVNQDRRIVVSACKP